MADERIGREIIKVITIDGPRPFFIPGIPVNGIDPIEHPDPFDIPEPSALVIYAPVPEIIIVCGITSPDKAGQKYQKAFSYNAKSLLPFIPRRYKEARVTVFDFFDGTKITYEFNDVAKPVSTQTTDLGQLKKDNYRHQRIDPAHTDVANAEDLLKEMLVDKEPDNNPMYYASFIDKWKKTDAPTKEEYLDAFNKGDLKEKSISIGDVYQYLMSTPDNSIAEFHIFSHSWPAGPVLVDTEQMLKPGPSPGKPLVADTTHFIDKDGRQIHFDPAFKFTPSLVGLDKKFKSYGFSQIWGCMAETSPKKMINKLMNPAKTKPALLKEAKADPNKKLFTFFLRADDFDELIEDTFHIFMMDTGNKPGESDPKSLNDIRKILTREMDNSYMRKLAQASKKDVLGALPGTGGDLDRSSNPKPQLMHVDMGRKYGDVHMDKGVEKVLSYIWQLTFYKEFMGIKFKPGEYHPDFGRGYGIYEP